MYWSDTTMTLLVLTESSLNDRAFYKEESLEETVSRSMEYEQLHKAISKLPETQKRRLLLYFFFWLLHR